MSRKRTRKEFEDKNNSDIVQSPKRQKIDQNIPLSCEIDENDIDIFDDNYDEYDDESDYDPLKEFDIDNKINPADYDRNQYMYKVARNHEIGVEEGGYAMMKWDIFVCNKLKINNIKLLKIFRKELIELGSNNNDWRDNEPILNIIDPDLYVYKYYNKQKWCDQFKKNIQKCYNHDYSEKCWNQLVENEKKGYFIRSRYQWIATEFIENNNKINIVSNIHNLTPRNKYKNIYNGLELIFESMLPLFNKFDEFKNRKNNQFQCIVKSQRYCINDMSGYKGMWHQEGLTENILLAGLYYFDKDIDLKGGQLKFRNVRSFADEQQTDIRYEDVGYGDGWDASDYGLYQTIDINEGTAVVFNNKDLVHRVRMIKNICGDNVKRWRSFCAFFIIDPNKRTDITTDTYCSLKREYYINIICNLTKCSFDIANIICEYSGCGMTLSEAKKLRNKDIEIRKNTKTKGRWGVICHGNCGIVQIWHKNGKANQYEHSEGYGTMQWHPSTNSDL